MTQRTRKFIGTIAIITFVMPYGPVADRLIAESRLLWLIVRMTFHG